MPMASPDWHYIKSRSYKEKETLPGMLMLQLYWQQHREKTAATEINGLFYYMFVLFIDLMGTRAKQITGAILVSKHQ